MARLRVKVRLTYRARPAGENDLSKKIREGKGKIFEAKFRETGAEPRKDIRKRVRVAL